MQGGRKDGCVANDEEWNEETTESWSGDGGVEAAETDQGEDHCWDVKKHSLSAEGPVVRDKGSVGSAAAPWSDFVDDESGKSIGEEEAEFDQQNEYTEDSYTGSAFFVVLFSRRNRLTDVAGRWNRLGAHL